MNLLSRAILSHHFLLSNHLSRKCIFSPRPITHIQQSSLYFTTNLQTNTIKLRAQQPRNPRPQNPSSSSGLNKAAEALPTWPKPSEIQYQPKIANSVSLIGHIQLPVRFHATPDGKHLSATFIAQQNGNISAYLYSMALRDLIIPVVFEGDLAHIVACHVKENDCVFVTGKLCVDPLPFVLSENQGKFHILGQKINFVHGLERKVLGRTRKDFGEVVDTVSRLDSVGTENFVNEHVGDSVLSVESDDAVMNIPEELRKSLKFDDKVDNKSSNNVETMKIGDADVKTDQKRLNNVGKADEKIDQKRLNNVGKADDKTDQKRLNNVGKSDDKIDQKRLNDVGKADDKIDQKRLNNVGKTKDGGSLYDSWRDLVRNPTDWWDCRERKSSGFYKATYPDFKHKTSGSPLWLNKAPQWVLPGIQGLEVGLPKEQRAKDGKEKDGNWKNLIENPEKWWDNRGSKINERSPDFKNKETGEALWLNTSPDWVLPKLPPLKDEKMKSTRII